MASFTFCSIDGSYTVAAIDVIFDVCYMLCHRNLGSLAPSSLQEEGENQTEKPNNKNKNQKKKGRRIAEALHERVRRATTKPEKNQDTREKRQTTQNKKKDNTRTIGMKIEEMVRQITTEKPDPRKILLSFLRFSD